MLEKTLENPLDSKEINPISPKRNQPWIFIRRTDADAEAPILWPPDVKNWLNGKDPDAGKDWGQEKKGMTEDEMVGWHHWLNRHGFVQTPRDGEGQGGLTCCSPWGHKELDKTWRPNNNPLGWRKIARKLEPFLHGMTSEVRMGECYQITDICIMIHNL